MRIKINSLLLQATVVCSLILLSFSSVQATHIVGGELNYECLGNDEYEISLTVFRDCFNGNPQAYFDDPASIGIFDVNNNLVTNLGQNGQLLIPLMNDDTLDPTLFDSCLVVPPNVCVHRTTYRDTITLPFTLGGYQLSYQRCCRNQTIQNIVNPLATGATYYNFISEQSLAECNSSAVFKEWPPNYICVNEPIVFDHSALDIDGDSLVYILCTPFDGADQQNPQPQPPNPPPYDNVTWLDPPYDLNNVMGGVPLAIDSETGLLTGTPNTIGQFVVGICVEEYRNGVLISTSRRDFQYNVGLCGEAISSFFAPAVDCDGFTVNFTNQSQDAPSYLWDFGDPNTTLDVSTATNPSYTYPDTGLYTITLIAGPNELCADTSFSTVSVQIPSLFVDFDLSIIDGCVFPAQVSFDDLSFDTISTIVEWDWQFSNGDSSDEQDPIWYLTESGVYSATLTATAANGCQVSHTDFISIDVLELGLQDTAEICVDGSVVLNPGTDPNLTYTWSPGETLSSTTSPSPTANPLGTTTYYLTVEDNQGCIYNDSVQVNVNELIIDFDDQIDYCEGDTVQLHDGAEPNLNYIWLPDENLIDGNTGTPSVYPDGPAQYTVTVFDSNTGCFYQDTIDLEPIIDEELPDDLEICDGESISINPNPNLNYTYSWSPAGTLNDPNDPNPIATPSNTTTYSVDIFDAANNCIITREVTVMVNPLPELNSDSLSICRNTTSSLNPGGNPNFNYTWSPTDGLDDANAPNPSLTATVNGETTYTVTIVNPTTNCVYVDSIKVLVPEDVEVTASDDEIVCETTLEISATTNTGTTFEWFSDQQLTNSIGNGADLEVAPGESSTYYVVTTDQYGCSSTDEVTVGSQATNVDVPAQVAVCEDNEIVMEAINNKPDDILTYQWLPEEFITNGGNTSTPTVLVGDDEVLTLIVENQYGCSDTLFVPLDVVENTINLMATADPDSIYPGESSQLEATMGNYSYQWSLGNLLDDDMIQNPVATPPETTTFDVFVEDEAGCKDTASVTVFLKDFQCEIPFIFVPNAFTPDNDGMNDVFFVRGNAIDEMYMAVYNRWGEKLFETRDLNTGWDGTYKGKELPPDVYGYFLELRCLNGEEYFTKGNVTLIR